MQDKSKWEIEDRLKFRGQAENGEWVYGSLLWYAGEPQIWDKDGKNFIVKPETVGQCTGLKDKNGKLIFEGDIIKDISGVPSYEYIVKWEENLAQFYITKINPQKYDNWKDWNLGRHDLDYIIIGNIYENKELLKETEQC